MRTLTYAQALAEAMAEELRRDPTVVLWGIDIGPYGGAFGATRGLYEEFGPERIIDMPVSEAGYTGVGVGAAATGLRPVVELQFSDWITIASDMLINQAANMRYMFGGVISVPLVLRAPVGGYVSAAAQHSHMFESMFAFVAGLKVVLPSTPYDAKGLLKSAIRDNNPVIFFEHKQLYEVEGEVPEEEYTIPLGQADVKREGSDVTLVTYSYMVTKSLAAAEELAKEGIERRSRGPAYGRSPRRRNHTGIDPRRRIAWWWSRRPGPSAASAPRLLPSLRKRHWTTSTSRSSV